VTPLVILDVVRKLLDMILDLVPHEMARGMLDDAAVRRAHRIGDLAEEAKFGGGDP
jgi:hypothetical protein